MSNFIGKSFSPIPLFDPTKGNLVREPTGIGAGWWAGAPCATFDPIANTFFLVYRLRQPRELGRGVECRIAVSENGIAFKDIWALPKTSLSALSIDRACLVHCLDGQWRLYIGHVDTGDKRWRISMMEADEPDKFDVSKVITLLTADDVRGEGVKDPNIFLIGRMYYLIASYAVMEGALTPDLDARKHSEGDIYKTGLIRSRSCAAISGDGVHFQYIGDITPLANPITDFQNADKPVWDDYCKRITALTPLNGGGYLAFYDGGASVSENYEERTGIATTFDLKTYYSLSPLQPALISPHASGSLRYVDVVSVGHELFCYYEMARDDGAHELRVSVVERD